MISKTNIKLEVNKEQLRLWIAALRSGEYQQSDGTLQNEHGYCCLGVACKIIIPKKDLLFEPNGFLSGVSPFFQPNAPQWLKEINNDFANYNDDALITFNDNLGASFEDIADMLEKTYLTHDNTTTSNT